jgi:hypothetical protein
MCAKALAHGDQGIDEARAQITKRLNPLLEKNARPGPTLFRVPEKDECPDIGMK